MNAAERQDMIARARAVPIEDEVARRGIALKRASTVERVGQCPVCGGTDRFGINVRKQVFNCRGCEKRGDVIALVQYLDDVGFTDAIRLLAGEPVPNRPARIAPRPAPVDDETRRQRARAGTLWQEAKPVVLTLADQYLLQTRKLDVPHELLADGETLRFHPNCPFGEKRYPCLLALWRAIAGDEPVAITRTALTPDAQKIGRMSLGPTAGAAVKLTPDVDVSYGLHIAEGLETGLAAMMRGFVPMWVTGNAGIRHFPVLAGIDCLSVIVDNDKPDQNGRRAGPDAAAECVSRWTAAGREVLLVKPIMLGFDMADITRRETGDG